MITYERSRSSEPKKVDMFWGDRSGTVVDPDGYNWMVGTHKAEPSAKMQSLEILLSMTHPHRIMVGKCLSCTTESVAKACLKQGDSLKTPAGSILSAIRIYRDHQLIDGDAVKSLATAAADFVSALSLLPVSPTRRETE
jgi:hypothetical protein